MKSPCSESCPFPGQTPSPSLQPHHDYRLKPSGAQSLQVISAGDVRHPGRAYARE